MENNNYPHNIRIPKYQNLSYDVGFKNVFGNPNHKNLLIGLLNTIIKFQDPIQDLEFLPAESNSFGIEGKRSVCDVRCRLSNGEHVIIEVQLKYEPAFNERVIYEACKEIAAQLQRSSERPSDSYKLEPVYVVSIVHFMRPHSKDALAIYDGVVWDYDIVHLKTGERLSDVMRFYFVELGNFNKSLSELGTFEEKVYFCLKRIGSLDSRPTEFSDKYFEELFTVTEFESLSIEQRKTYLSKMTTEEKHARQLAGAHEQGIEQGLEIGRKEGREEGREEGLEIGRKEGREEEKETIAKKMLEDGMDTSLVVKYSGFSLERIQSIQESLSIDAS